MEHEGVLGHLIDGSHPSLRTVCVRVVDFRMQRVTAPKTALSLILQPPRLVDVSTVKDPNQYSPQPRVRLLRLLVDGLECLSDQ